MGGGRKVAVVLRDGLPPEQLVAGGFPGRGRARSLHQIPLPSPARQASCAPGPALLLAMAAPQRLVAAEPVRKCAFVPLFFLGMQDKRPSCGATWEAVPCPHWAAGLLVVPGSGTVCTSMVSQSQTLLGSCPSLWRLRRSGWGGTGTILRLDIWPPVEGKFFPPSVLGGVELPHSRLVGSLGSWTQSRWQWGQEGLCAESPCVPVAAFPGPGGPSYSLLSLDPRTDGLLQCCPWGYP